MKMNTTCATIALTLGLAAAANAAVIFDGAGSIRTATNWTTDTLPAGDVGTIDISGATVGNANLGGWGATTINHTAGNIAGQFNAYNEANLTWNISGTASYTLTGTQTFFTNGTTNNMSGGTINTEYTISTEKATGVLNISGGTINSTSTSLFETKNGGIINLSGGTVTANSATTLFNGTADIGGSATINASNATTLGAVDFLSGWTGSLDLDAATDWSAVLISSGATLDGVDIDSGNIDQFNISGGSISAVPEPSSAALLGLGGIALILRRRK